MNYLSVDGTDDGQGSAGDWSKDGDYLKSKYFFHYSKITENEKLL